MALDPSAVASAIKQRIDAVDTTQPQNNSVPITAISEEILSAIAGSGGVPSAPEGLALEIDDWQIFIQPVLNGADDSTNFEYDIVAGDGSGYSPSPKANGISHSFTGLVPDTQHTIYVRTTNPYGKSAWVSDAVVTTSNNDQIRTVLVDLENARQRILDAEQNIIHSQQELDDAEARIADAEQNINDAEVRLGVAEQELDAAEVRITNAEQNIIHSQQELDDAEARIADAVQNINAAEVRLGVAENDILSTEQDLIAARGRIDAAELEIANLFTDLNDESLRIDAVEGDITGIQIDINDIAIDISTINTTIGGIETNVSGLQTDVSNLNTTADNLQTTITNVDTTLTNRLDGVDVDVDSLKNNLSNLAVRVRKETKTRSDSDSQILSSLAEQGAYREELRRRIVRDEELIGAAVEVNPETGEIINKAFQYTNEQFNDAQVLIDGVDARVTTTVNSISLLEDEITDLNAEIDVVAGSIEATARAVVSESLSALEPAHSFNFFDSAQNWTAANGTLTANNGNITLTYGDIENSQLNFVAEDNPTIRLTISRDAGTGWTGDVIIERDDTTTETFTGVIEDIPSGGDIIRTIDFRGSSEFSGNVTRVRLALGASVSDEFTVKSIVIGKPDAAAIELEDLTGRVTQAELDIDAVEGTLTQKLDTTFYEDNTVTFANVEQTLSTSPTITAIENNVSQTQGDLSTTIGRVDQVEIDADNNTSAISTLEGQVNNPTTNTSVLYNLTQQAQATADGNSNSITSIDNRLTTAEGDITANTGLIQGVQTDVDGNTSAISTLEGQVNDVNTGLAATFSIASSADTTASGNATSITNLENRVTTAEGDITANATLAQQAKTTADGNATSITTLENRVTTAEGDITTQSGLISDVQLDADNNATAITGIQGEINDVNTGLSATYSLAQQAKTTADGNTSSITTLENRVSSTETDITAVTGRVDQVEIDADGNATAITGLQGSVNDPATGLSATYSIASEAKTTADGNTSSITSLTNRVDTAEGDITAVTGRVDQVEIDADGNASAISTIQGQVNDVDTGLAASYDLAQQAKTTADGNTSSITNINNEISDINGDISANTSFIQQVENKADGNTTAITALEGSVYDNTTGLSASYNLANEAKTTADQATSSIRQNAVSIKTNNDKNTKNEIQQLRNEVDVALFRQRAIDKDASYAFAIDELKTAVSDEGALAQSIQQLEAATVNNEQELFATSTRIDQVETNINGNASAISQLNLDVDSLGRGIDGALEEINAVDLRADDISKAVSSVEGQINDPQNNTSTLFSFVQQAQSDADGNATSITKLTSRVDNNEDFASAQLNLNSTYNSELDTLTARASLTTDVNNRVSGFIVDDDGINRKIEFLSDSVAFIDESGTAKIYYDLVNSRYVFDGEIQAESGTFAGVLQAATGTFTGEVTVGSIISGKLSGATGTFTGEVKAGSLISGELVAATGTFTGNLEAAGGTFTGALDAATGNFTGVINAGSIISGSLSSVDGTFTGELVAATGSFTGEVKAGSLISGELVAATGVFTGNLEAAGGTFTGALDAATGNFTGTVNVGSLISGTLQAVDGQFSGTLDAVDGNFIGELKAATGTFAGLVSGGSVNIGSGTFVVDSQGNMTANSGTFNGSLGVNANIDGQSPSQVTGGIATAQGRANDAYNYADTTSSNLSTLSNSLGGLAYDDVVEAAKLGNTVIQGGYLKTDLIETGAITTGKLAIVGSGLNVSPNPEFTNGSLEGWQIFNFSLVERNTSSGTSAIRNAPTHYIAEVPNDGNSYISQTCVGVPCNEGDEFAVSMSVAGGGSGINHTWFISIAFDDIDGNNLGGGNWTIGVYGTGWKNVKIGSDQAPNGAHSIRRLNIQREAGGTGTSYVTKVLVERKVGGDLVVDGAIDGQTITGATFVGGEFTVTNVGSDFVRITNSDSFGVSSDLLEWFGEKVSGVTWDFNNQTPILSGMGKTNARTYTTIHGDVYFGGTFQAGTISSSASTTSLGSAGEASIEFTSNGNMLNVSASYSWSLVQKHSQTTCPTTPPDPVRQGTLVIEELVSGSWTARRSETINGSFSCQPALNESGEIIEGTYTWNASQSFTYSANQESGVRRFRVRFFNMTGGGSTDVATSVNQTASIASSEE